MEPKTREEMIEKMNSRIFGKINELIVHCPALSEWPEVKEELNRHDTDSVAWYNMSTRFLRPVYNMEPYKPQAKLAAIALSISKLVLNRNAYQDGLPFCPLCGKLGFANNDGSPVIDAQVCAECDYRKIIPARIRNFREKSQN